MVNCTPLVSLDGSMILINQYHVISRAYYHSFSPYTQIKCNTLAYANPSPRRVHAHSKKCIMYVLYYIAKSIILKLKLIS